MKKLYATTLAACLLFCAACTPIPAPTSTPTPTPTPTPTLVVPDGPAVKTDWSQLTPFEAEKPIYTRRYAEFTDTLIPADDYGPLIPFLGDKVGGLSRDGNRYGLMTLQGEIVADPGFAKVWRGISTSGYHGDGPLPYLMLQRGAVAPTREGSVETLWAMAAPDGSWCTDFKYVIDSELVIWGWGYTTSCSEDGVFALDGEALVYLDGATGVERVRIEDVSQGQNPYRPLASACWVDGAVLYQWDDFSTGVGEYHYFRFDPATGVSAELTKGEWERLERSLHPTVTEEPKTVDGNELHGFLVDGDGWNWYRDGAELVFLRRGEERRLKTDSDPVDIKWGNVLFLGGADFSLSYMTMAGKTLAQYPEGLSNAYDVKGCDWVTGEKYLCFPVERGYDYYNANGEFLAHSPLPATLAGGMFDTGSGLRTFDGEWVFRYPLPLGEWD